MKLFRLRVKGWYRFRPGVRKWLNSCEAELNKPEIIQKIIDGVARDFPAQKKQEDLK